MNTSSNELKGAYPSCFRSLKSRSLYLPLASAVGVLVLAALERTLLVDNATLFWALIMIPVLFEVFMGSNKKSKN